MLRRGARMGEDRKSQVPGLALLPAPAKSRTGGGVWGAWKGPGCWKGPEHAPGVTLDPGVGAAVVGGLQEWQRGTGCRTNISPVQAALPSPSLPQIPGVSPHTWVGVRVAEGAKKEPEAAAAEPGEPFYCTAKQGTSPSSVPRSREEPQSSAQPSKQDQRAAGNRGLGAGRSPMVSPLLLSQALQPKLGQG